MTYTSSALSGLDQSPKSYASPADTLQSHAPLILYLGQKLSTARDSLCCTYLRIRCPTLQQIFEGVLIVLQLNRLSAKPQPIGFASTGLASRLINRLDVYFCEHFLYDSIYHPLPAHLNSPFQDSKGCPSWYRSQCIPWIYSHYFEIRRTTR